MPVVIKGAAKLMGLQHAEQNTIIGYFTSFFSKGTITITGYAVAAGGTMITVAYNGPGGAGHSGTEVFTVPVSDVGSGVSFLIVASVMGAYALYRSRRSSAPSSEVRA